MRYMGPQGELTLLLFNMLSILVVKCLRWQSKSKKMASSSEEQEEVCKCLEKVILEDHIGNSTKVILRGGQIIAWKDEHGEEFLFLVGRLYAVVMDHVAADEGLKLYLPVQKSRKYPNPKPYLPALLKLWKNYRWPLMMHRFRHPYPFQIPMLHHSRLPILQYNWHQYIRCPGASGSKCCPAFSTC